MSAAFVGELERRSIPISQGAAALEAASLDFGRLVRGVSLGVISPRTHEQVQTTVEMARKHAVYLTPRTQGNSQSGQSVAVGGFTLDLSQLSRVGAPDAERLVIESDAGASWRRVMSSCLEQGLIPKVMPMNLDLSVGGTLSAGGVGASCHRYGNCAAAVAAVSFLTGAGELVRCTREQNAELFALALGGQGRCGILLSVTLELRRTTSRVETCYLLYDSVQECLANLLSVAAHPEIEYAEAYCSSLFQGLRVSERGRRPLYRWFGGLQVTREVEGTTRASDAWLDGLGWKEIVHRESDSIAGFSARYDMRFELMRRSGDWGRPHPWFESFLPPSRAASVISQALSSLPPFFGDGHRIFLLRVDERLPYLSMPVAESGYAVAFAVLPTAIAEAALPDALPVLERLEELVTREGGKRYLSGWIADRGAEFWRRHYGSHYEDWTRAKLKHDPDGVLSSALFGRLDAELYGRAELDPGKISAEPPAAAS
jgi:cytokinin dehydrogenase